MRPTRRRALVLITSAAAAIIIADSGRAASSRQLLSEGEAALRRLYLQQPHAKALGAHALAVLVFPRVVKVGVILAGGQTGDGVLFKRGRAAGYFNLSSASFGPQAGGQTFSYVLFLMTAAAVDYLAKTDGWSLGTGPTVVVVDKAAAVTFDSTTATQDFYGFAFAQKGLMAGIDLNGSKITRIKPDS